MHNVIKIYLLIFVVFASFVSCSGDSDSNATNNKSEEQAKVKLVAELFCKELVNENYKKMAEYVDNSSKNTLKEWSFNEVNYFENVQFLSIDTCVIKGTKALCVCNFEDHEMDITDSLELNKFATGWKVKIKWGTEVVNPFIYNTSLSMKPSYPDITPYLTDSLERLSFENAAMLIGEFIHYPDNVIGFLEKHRFDEMRTNNEVDERDSIFPKMKYGEYNQMSGWNATFDYDKMDISMEYFFNTDGMLQQLRFTLISEENNPFAYFQEYAAHFTKHYGKPYNATHLKVEDYYKYKKLKWFIKSYNEELFIEQGEYSLIIAVVEAG